MILRVWGFNLIICEGHSALWWPPGRGALCALRQTLRRYEFRVAPEIPHHASLPNHRAHAKSSSSCLHATGARLKLVTDNANDTDLHGARVDTEQQRRPSGDGGGVERAKNTRRTTVFRHHEQNTRPTQVLSASFARISSLTLYSFCCTLRKIAKLRGLEYSRNGPCDHVLTLERYNKPSMPDLNPQSKL